MNLSSRSKPRKLFDRGWKAELFDPRRRFLFLLSIGVCCLISLVIVFVVHNSTSLEADASRWDQRANEPLETKPVLHPQPISKKPVVSSPVAELDKRNQLIATEEAKNDRRREFVVAIFESLYKTYINTCSHFPPQKVENSACNDWFGTNLIRIDTLDTLWLMGLKYEFLISTQWVKESFDSSADEDVTVSGTSSRLIGGFLGAFELSNRPIFLQVAAKLADRLLPAFESNKHGLPLSMINLKTGETKNPPQEDQDMLLLGEISSTQLELSFISHHLNEPRYGQKALHIWKYLQLHPLNDEPGVYASKVSASRGQFINSILTLNAPSDAFFNNLFKLYRMFYKRVKWVNEMWFEARNGIMKHLATSIGSFAYAKEVDMSAGSADLKAGNVTQSSPAEMKVGHSSCVMAALLALHSQDLSDDAPKAKSLFGFSESFVATCVEMNVANPNGIATEFSRFLNDKIISIPDQGHPRYRADTFEALFYMSRLTGDPNYRNIAWELFEAVIHHFQLRVPGTKMYTQPSSKKTLDSGIEQPMEHLNVQTMRFLTKVLKFLFLTYSDNDVLPINKYVWNADGHAFSILKPDITLYG